MTERIKKVLSAYLTENGRAEGIRLIAKASDRSISTVGRWIDRGFPDSHSAFITAVACGVERKEALEIAQECFPDSAKVG